MKQEDVQGVIQSHGAKLFKDSKPIDGHLSVEGRMVVDGDLKVQGTLQVSEGAALFVNGTVICRNFYAEGDFVTSEKLTAEHCIFGNYEAGITYAPEAQAKVFLSGNHAFEFQKETFDHEVDITDASRDYSEEEKFLSAKAIELIFLRPRQYNNGDESAEVMEFEWLEALQEDSLLAG